MSKIYEVCSYGYDEWIRLGYFDESGLKAILKDIKKVFDWMTSDEGIAWDPDSEEISKIQQEVEHMTDVMYFLEETIGVLRCFTASEDAYRYKLKTQSDKDYVLNKILTESVHEHTLNKVMKE